MFRIALLALLATLSVGCSASSSTAPASAHGAGPGTDPSSAACETPVTARLERLHRFTVSEDELPARVTTDYRKILDGLRPPSSATDGAFTIEARPYAPTLSPVLHHAPRFQGELEPRIVHSNREAIGRPSDGGFGRALATALSPGDKSVVVALWRDTRASDLNRLFGMLADADVETINLVGRQDLPRMSDFEPPAAATALYAQMKGPDGRLIAARARATLQLERVVFEAHGHDLDLSSRIIDPRRTLSEQSRSYIDFLRREQLASACDVPDDHLVWLYRARFAPDPLAIVPIEPKHLPEVSPDETLQDLLRRI